jgi:cytoskeletal protein CcmA (bactofilin family)
MASKDKPFGPLAPPEENNQMTVLIQKGCEFEGKLCFEGTARIDGRFKGQIYTKDILIIGEGALVQADIEADVVIICGNMYGNVLALNRVELKKTGVFKGTVCTPGWSVEDGAIFEGQTKMVREASELAAATVLGDSTNPVSH